MTDQRFTPEEFARLLALPPDHPDRRRAESDPRWGAWRRMLAAFESRAALGLDDGELRAADAALAPRLEAEIGVAPGRLYGETAPSPVRRARQPRGFGAWFRPAWTPALAFAAMLVVAGGVWIYAGREPAPRVVRSGDAGAPVVTLSVAGGRELRWNAVPGASEYRVTFLGPDLREIATVAGLTATTLKLDPGNRPAGLVSGAEVAATVAAYRDGLLLAESKTKALRLP